MSAYRDKSQGIAFIISEGVTFNQNKDADVAKSTVDEEDYKEQFEEEEESLLGSYTDSITNALEIIEEGKFSARNIIQSHINFLKRLLNKKDR